MWNFRERELLGAFSLRTVWAFVCEWESPWHTWGNRKIVFEIKFKAHLHRPKYEGSLSAILACSVVNPLDGVNSHLLQGCAGNEDELMSLGARFTDLSGVGFFFPFLSLDHRYSRVQTWHRFQSQWQCHSAVSFPHFNHYRLQAEGWMVVYLQHDHPKTIIEFSRASITESVIRPIENQSDMHLGQWILHTV